MGFLSVQPGVLQCVIVCWSQHYWFLCLPGIGYDLMEIKAYGWHLHCLWLPAQSPRDWYCGGIGVQDQFLIFNLLLDCSSIGSGNFISDFENVGWISAASSGNEASIFPQTLDEIGLFHQV
jgi:hypothetical protein